MLSNPSNELRRQIDRAHDEWDCMSLDFNLHILIYDWAMELAIFIGGLGSRYSRHLGILWISCSHMKPLERVR